MISTFQFSATGGGASLTYAEVGTNPATATALRKDTDANISGGNVESVAGPVVPGTGRSAKTTSSVQTVSQRSQLSLVIDVSGAGMKATGFAQHGLQYVSHSPVRFHLDIEALELDGDHATLDFRLEQPQDGDHLRELSEEIAPLAVAEKRGFERVAGHLTLFRLNVKSILRGGKPRLQVHSFHERECVTVKPEISARDFEFDPKTQMLRYMGHLDGQGNRVKTIEIDIDPGRTSDKNNLILTMLGTQSSTRDVRQPCAPGSTPGSTPEKTVST